MSRIAVIGAGAWGTALAIHAARAGAGVSLVARDVSRPAGANLPATIDLTTELPRDADAILLCVPTQHMREALMALRPHGPLLVCCKGVETGTSRLPLEVVADILPRTIAAFLTGPNFASEIAEGLPAAAVIAASQEAEAFREYLIETLTTPTFRLYGSDDPMGAQLGGAAKNVIAIAAGAVIGAGYGENARAALVTRGLAELSRLIVAQGGRVETASGLSGLGDLVLTCTGAGSRNFSYGLALGRGERPALEGRPVVEGIATAAALVARAPGVDLPICHAVAELLGGRVSLGQALAQLMSRPRRNEF